MSEPPPRNPGKKKQATVNWDDLFHASLMDYHNIDCRYSMIPYIAYDIPIIVINISAISRDDINITCLAMLNYPLIPATDEDFTLRWQQETATQLYLFDVQNWQN